MTIGIGLGKKDEDGWCNQSGRERRGDRKKGGGNKRFKEDRMGGRSERRKEGRKERKRRTASELETTEL